MNLLRLLLTFVAAIACGVANDERVLIHLDNNITVIPPMGVFSGSVGNPCEKGYVKVDKVCTKIIIEDPDKLFKIFFSGNNNN